MRTFSASASPVSTQGWAVQFRRANSIYTPNNGVFFMVWLCPRLSVSSWGFSLNNSGRLLLLVLSAQSKLCLDFPGLVIPLISKHNSGRKQEHSK